MCTPNLSESSWSFSGAFAKLRKATISVVMPACLSIRPSVRMEQLGSHRTDFDENLYFSF